MGWQGSFITALLVYLFAKRPAQTYLLEFCTFEAPDEWKVRAREGRESAMTAEGYETDAGYMESRSVRHPSS